MLRACHRILKPGGIIAFVVVAIAGRLPDRDVAEAIEVGPPFVDAGSGYRELMIGAGFEDVTVTDVTDDFLTTTRAWLHEWVDAADQLIPAVGIEAFDGVRDENQRTVDAIERGLLCRHLITAHRG